jgi:hypothetical protein
MTMSDLSRRNFLVSVAALPVLAPRLRINNQQEQLDEGVLRAVAEAVLPSELSNAQQAAAVTDYLRWARGYRRGAERNHGYGTAQIGTLAADPLPEWAAQLRALDAEARQSTNSGFAALPLAARRTMIAAQLGSERTLPNPLGARHVALALLAHFYASPLALDLCYRARIGRETCRPLGEASARPVPLGGD